MRPVERRAAGEGMMLPADPRRDCGTDDHRHRVPADDGFDAAFEFAVARLGGAVGGADSC